MRPFGMVGMLLLSSSISCAGTVKAVKMVAEVSDPSCRPCTDEVGDQCEVCGDEYEEVEVSIEVPIEVPDTCGSDADCSARFGGEF